MSCGNNNSPCWGNQNSGCGVDPCYTQKLSTDVVLYGGPTLPCTDVQACDSVTVALQKIDNEICTLNSNLSNNLLANNGVYRIGNTIKLGGVLTEATTITTYPNYTLGITGLIHDASPSYILSSEVDGVLRKTYVSDLLAVITADNGLTKDGDTNIQLGGVLITPTVITTDNTNTLFLDGLQNPEDNNFTILIQENSAIQEITYANLSEYIQDDISVNNGLSKDSNVIQLGGILLKNTNIDLDGYALTLSSYDGGANPLVYDITGKQGSDFIKYYGVRESQDEDSMFTTSVNISKLHVIKSLPVDVNATGAYLANSFLAISGKTSDDGVDAILGVYVPNSDVLLTPAPDPIYDSTSYIRFNEGTSRIYSNYLIIDNPDPDDSNTEKGTVEIKSALKLPNLPVYADNTAALGGGLVAGDVYRTSIGVVMVVF